MTFLAGLAVVWLLALAIQFRRRTGSLDPRDFLPPAWRHREAREDIDQGSRPGDA